MLQFKLLDAEKLDRQIAPAFHRCRQVRGIQHSMLEKYQLGKFGDTKKLTAQIKG